MKYFFFDKKIIKNSNNIFYNFYKLKRENVIFKSDEDWGSFTNAYYTIISDDDVVYLYYRCSHLIGKGRGPVKYSEKTRTLTSCCDKHVSKTCVAISKDNGLSFIRKIENKDDNILFNKKCISHNFTVFKNKENNFYGMGGLHTWPNFHTKCYKNEKTILKNNKSIVDPNSEHPCYCNGLYLLSSKNKLDWDLCKKLPIISGIHKGQYDNRRGWGWSEFDGMVSVLYSNKFNKYFLYCRSNIKNGIRYIQYTTSNDLINWDNFKLISMDKKLNVENGDNYYYINVVEEKESELFFGFSPYFNNKEAYINMCYSYDGIKWNKLYNMLNGNNVLKRCSIQNVHNYLLSKDKREYYFYIHENYFSLYKNSELPSVVRYSIRKDGFKSIFSKNGYIEVNIKNANIIKLNYKTHDNGYILLEETNKNKINIKLSGDEVDEIIQLPLNELNDDRTIKISIVNSEIYTISF